MDSELAAALRFRTAIDTTDTGLVAFKNFPHGACGDASELLAEYFRDCGLGSWRYRMGMGRDGSLTHAWIEREGVLADITADQFPELEPPGPVVVGADWAWHDRHFTSTPGERLAGLSFWDGLTHAAVSAAYRTLREVADAIR